MTQILLKNSILKEKKIIQFVLKYTLEVNQNKENNQLLFYGTASKTFKLSIKKICKPGYEIDLCKVVNLCFFEVPSENKI